jgi:hypothetical protein
MTQQSRVDSLRELLAGVNRKIDLAKTSSAYFKGTNKHTLAKLGRHRDALQAAIDDLLNRRWKLLAEQSDSRAVADAHP